MVRRACATTTPTTTTALCADSYPNILLLHTKYLDQEGALIQNIVSRLAHSVCLAGQSPPLHAPRTNKYPGNSDPRQASESAGSRHSSSAAHASLGPQVSMKIFSICVKSSTAALASLCQCRWCHPSRTSSPIATAALSRWRMNSATSCDLPHRPRRLRGV
jgi:hypothetical protein